MIMKSTIILNSFFKILTSFLIITAMSACGGGSSAQDPIGQSNFLSTYDDSISTTLETISISGRIQGIYDENDVSISWENLSTSETGTVVLSGPYAQCVLGFCNIAFIWETSAIDLAYGKNQVIIHAVMENGAWDEKIVTVYFYPDLLLSTSMPKIIDPAGVELSGNMDPHGGEISYWFEWGVDPNLNSPTPTSKQLIQSGQSGLTNVSQWHDNFIPEKIYYYRIVADGGTGPVKGEIKSFYISNFNSGPNVNASYGVREAHLISIIYLPHAEFEVWFEYATNPYFDNAITTLSEVIKLDYWEMYESVPKHVTNLSPDTTYYYRVHYKDIGSNSITISGSQFTTLPYSPPVISNIELVTNDSGEVIVNALINSSGIRTSARVEWSTSPEFSPASYSFNHHIVDYMVTDYELTKKLSGLSSGTTYYYKVTAWNDIYYIESPVFSFVTP